MSWKRGSILQKRYRLDEPLGNGSRFTTWKAGIVGQSSAACVVKTPLDSMPPFSKAEQEAWIARHTQSLSWTHPNWANNTDLFFWKSRPFLIRPFCSGVSLYQQILSLHALPEPVLAKILAQVGGFLNYSHSAPVQLPCRNLKPKNIISDQAGTYFVTDAHRFEYPDDQGENLSTEKAEQLIYTSPEALQGQKLSVEHDIFVFGTILYECCRGFLDADFSLAQAVLLQRPLSNLKGYPRRLQDLIFSALALNPSQRPTAADLQHAGLHYLGRQSWPAFSVYTPAPFDLQPIPSVSEPQLEEVEFKQHVIPERPPEDVALQSRQDALYLPKDEMPDKPPVNIPRPKQPKSQRQPPEQPPAPISLGAGNPRWFANWTFLTAVVLVVGILAFVTIATCKIKTETQQSIQKNQEHRDSILRSKSRSN